MPGSHLFQSVSMPDLPTTSSSAGGLAGAGAAGGVAVESDMVLSV